MRKRNIGPVFKDVCFCKRNEVEEAKRKLDAAGVSGQEVIKWLSNASKNWHGETLEDFIYGVENLEEIFGARFSLSQLIDAYFVNGGEWYMSGQYLLKEFNLATGRDITACEVAELIDLDFVRGSYCPGIDGMLRFIFETGGDTKPFLKRLIKAGNLSRDEISDIVLLGDHIDIDPKDAEELLRYVDFGKVDVTEIDEYYAFFHKFTPELMAS